MKYSKLRAKQQKEVDALPIFFAFSDEQLQEILESNGIMAKDLVQIRHGGLCRKEDAKMIYDTFLRLGKEMQDFLLNKDNLLDALVYEFANRELAYSIDIDEDIKDICEELGIRADENQEIIKKAYSKYINTCDF